MALHMASGNIYTRMKKWIGGRTRAKDGITLCRPCILMAYIVIAYIVMTYIVLPM